MLSETVTNTDKETKVIDFHCHILPGIDDGSHDVSESLALIEEEIRQGVQTIVFTPHFYANRDSVDHFLSVRSKSFHKLQSAMAEKNISLHTYLGAEVYYFGGIGKAETVSKLCIQGTNMLLLEMPFCQWTKDMLADIKLLVNKQKFTIILAHIERYFDFQKDKGIMEQVLELPVTLQINAGSYLTKTRLMDFAGKKKLKNCLQLLQEDFDILLGSDTHNMKTRLPNLAAGRAVIANKLGADRLDAIDSLGERMLKHDKE